MLSIIKKTLHSLKKSDDFNQRNDTTGKFLKTKNSPLFKWCITYIHQWQ